MSKYNAPNMPTCSSRVDGKQMLLKPGQWTTTYMTSQVDGQRTELFLSHVDGNIKGHKLNNMELRKTECVSCKGTESKWFQSQHRPIPTFVFNHPGKHIFQLTKELLRHPDLNHNSLVWSGNDKHIRDAHKSMTHTNLLQLKMRTWTQTNIF